MANWYVRASGGSGAGTSWTAAWTMAQLSAAMGSLNPGDTVWFAGGTYGPYQLEITASGTAGNVITFQRVTAADGVPTAAAGWNPAFDSQIVHNAATGAVGLIISASYVTVDGRTGLMGAAGGWVIHYAPGGNGSGVWNNAPATHVTLRYITCWGPGIVAQASDVRGLDITSTNLKSFWTVQYCEVGNGGDTSVYFAVAGGTFTDILMEYCWIHDGDCLNEGTFHPNACILGPSNRSIFRYNKFYNIPVEGLFPAYDVSNMYVYGNLFYQGTLAPNNGRAFEVDHAAVATNVFLYNNTMDSLPLGFQCESALSSTGCVFQNNIVWQGGGDAFQAGWTHDHNFYSGTSSGGTGDISSGANPFVNSAAFDYHLTSAVAANRPRDKGIAIAPVSGQTINIDPDGNIRGADGNWDIGAYEYNAGGGGGGGSFWPIRQI